MKKQLNLGTGRIGKTLFSLALPAIIAQILNLLYNVVDRIYIGKMENGGVAMAGIGAAMPIILLVSAFSVLIGNGGAPLAAIKIGKKDIAGAEKILSNSFICLLAIGALTMTVFGIFKEPLLRQFGASTATIGYADSYVSVYLFGTLFVQLTLGMNPFINTQGFAKTGMISVAIGAVLNIVLDPIFIFALDMGVSGAALASVISQLFSMLWVFAFLFGKKTLLRIRLRALKPSLAIIGKILSLGIAPFIMYAAESFILIAINAQLLRFGGDTAVAAMTVISSLSQIVMLPLLGLAQGAQPIIGFNYGAGNFDRIRKTFKIFLVSCLVFASTFMALCLFFAEGIAGVFNSDPEFVLTASHMIRVYFSAICVFGAQIACQQTFLALGKAKQSMLLVILRKLVLLIPLVYVLPLFLGNSIDAVMISEPITDIVSTLVTVICFYVFYKNNISEKRISAKAA